MTNISCLRQRCFFDITIADKNVGRIVFELFNDICPKTCDNFRSLCTGEKGLGKQTEKPLHYKNVIFHRVVKNFVIQSGDFSLGNGKGGESIFGGTFNDENFVLKHDKPFLLSMANRGKNTNGSQFFITLNPAPHLDGVHVVFGHVLSGQEIVNEIQNHETGKDGKPVVDIVISNCGELIPQIKPKDKKKKHKKKRSEGEITDEEREASKKRKKDKKHKKHKKSKENKKSDNESNEEEDKESELLNECSIKPEEIPDIPENKFLMRKIETQNNERNDINRDQRYDKNSPRRKVKGRGPTRYRTPSPSRHYRSGSETPPHWKSAQSRLITLKDVISGKNRNSRDDRNSTRKRFEGRNDESRWQKSVFSRNNNREFDIRDKFQTQQQSYDSEIKESSGRQIYNTRKRVFREEPPINSKHSKRDSSPLNQREEQNENITSNVSDSENFRNTEIRHSVKSEVKLNVRNKRDNSRDRNRSESPIDLKNIPLPDSDTQKKHLDEKREKIRNEKMRERERRHRRSNSRERVSSRRRRHSSDSK